MRCVLPLIVDVATVKLNNDVIFIPGHTMQSIFFDFIVNSFKQQDYLTFAFNSTIHPKVISIAS